MFSWRRIETRFELNLRSLLLAVTQNGVNRRGSRGQVPCKSNRAATRQICLKTSTLLYSRECGWLCGPLRALWRICFGANMSATLGRLNENPLVKTFLAHHSLLLLVYPGNLGESSIFSFFFKSDPKATRPILDPNRLATAATYATRGERANRPALFCTAFLVHVGHALRILSVFVTFPSQRYATYRETGSRQCWHWTSCRPQESLISSLLLWPYMPALLYAVDMRYR